MWTLDAGCWMADAGSTNGSTTGPRRVNWAALVGIAAVRKGNGPTTRQPQQEAPESRVKTCTQKSRAFPRPASLSARAPGALVRP